LSRRSMRDSILNGDILKTTLSLAWPVMLSNAFQTIYNLTDAFWLGKLGPEAVSAPSVSWPIMFLMISFSAGFGIAGISLVSQYTGSGQEDMAGKAAGQLIFILIISSLSVAVLGFFLAERILLLINVPLDVLPVARDYLKITFLGIPFMFSFFGFRSLLRGFGDTRTPMILSVGSSILDMLMDPFFVFGWLGLPAMGAAGAALTTVITRGIAGIIGIYLLFTGNIGLHIEVSDLKPDPHLMRKIASIGLPSSIGQSGNALGFTILTALVATEDRMLGGEGLLLSAYGIGSRITSLIHIIIIGGVSALSTMIGQNLGAGKMERSETIIKKIFTSFIGISIIECIIVYLFRNPIYRAFISDKAVISLGSTYMTYMVFFIPFFVAFRLCGGVFNAAGQTKASMGLSLVRLWGLRIPLSYLLALNMGLGAVGIWLGMGLGNVGGAAIALILLARGTWKTRVIEKEPQSKPTRF